MSFWNRVLTIIPKALNEIVASAETEDDAMKDYAKKLLPEGSVIVDENNPSCVILKKLSLMVEGRDDMEIDLTGDLSKKPKFDVKEGIRFKIRIDFIVQVIEFVWNFWTNEGTALKKTIPQCISHHLAILFSPSH